MRSALITMAVGLLSACAGVGVTRDTVRERFGADTECPKASVGVTDLPGNAYRAEGCGQFATYVCPVVDGYVTSCMRESDPRPTGFPDAGAGSR